MMGRQAWVGGALRRRKRVADLIDHIGAVTVPDADAAHIADIMAQQRYHEMEPIARCNSALADMFAEQNLPPDKGHYQRMFHIVIKRVRIGDAPQRHALDP